MSRENVVLFTREINRDRDLAGRIETAPATAASWVQIAYDAGFDFTAAEFASVVEQALGRKVTSDTAVREYLDAQAEVGAREFGRQIMDAFGGAFMATDQENMNKWSQLVAKAWTDEKLKKRLMDSPAEVLKEHGIEMPAGMDIRVVENTEKVTYLPLPPKPEGNVSELSPDQLAAVAGGFCCCFCRTCVVPTKYIVFDPEFVQARF